MVTIVSTTFTGLMLYVRPVIFNIPFYDVGTVTAPFL